MRFFKYLVFIFASIISVDALAAWKSFNNGSNSYVYSTALEACRAAYSNNSNYSYRVEEYGTRAKCFVKVNGIEYNDGNLQSDGNNCPVKDTMSVFFFNKNSTSVPQRRCINGCTYEYAGGPVTNYPDSKMVVLWATGNNLNCSNTDSDSPNNNTPPCDFKDPYGGCYVPPDDKCIRLKDGSITCPESNPPPKNNTCNGATYCKRPPEGCGEGYVSGSFNGEQLCVRSGPNKPSDPPKPDDPQDPNNCMNGGSYCPQPPDNKSCPAGYTETTYNGSKICVKNNPDPEKPNPNDPNTDSGGGSSEPTDGGGDGGTGGSINLKPVIDAINSLKAALLSAIDGVSKKLTTLIDGQKETNKKLDISNDHLKNIKDESVKTNDKLDKSNGHLEKIEEATQATSEAVGESNKKLDGIKDAVEGMYKCKNEAYNPSDKNSPKYRECTEQDVKNGFGEEPSMPFKELDLGQINTALFKVTGQCPAPYKLFLPVVNHTFDIDISKLCDVLAIIGLFIALAAMIHGIAILVENS
ncbi:hypothetical protein [Acinetobacter sp. MN12]|uniref:hypothetical protein n=1 Tax=Acinetobacter sp. MN12 TaxID=1513354 RepID=UPI00051B2F32|nr:hypothetical protein [Acinetobacter sp. MN12]